MRTAASTSRLTLVATALALAALVAPGAALAGKTLDAVKARGEVACGVNTSAPGFSNVDSQGQWPCWAIRPR
jgi:general L-amino acid transport system substrate-binding protein